MDKTITYSIINDEEGHRMVYTFSDSSQVTIFTRSGYFLLPASDKRYILSFDTELQREEAALMHWLIGFAHNHTPTQTYVLLATFSAIFLALGLGFLLYTKTLWQLRISIGVQGVKPTNAALVMYRISGVIFIALAFVPVAFLL